MAINLYSKASVDSLLSGKLSISSLSNAATSTLNATVPTTGQVLSFDGTDLKWVTPAGGATWGSITGTLSSQTDLNTALNARVSTAGDTMDNNALLEFNDTFNSTHLGIDGNGVTVENAGLGISANLNKDDLVFTDGVDTASIGLAGVTFADGTTQTTAYTGGGTLVGNQISIYSGYLYNETTSTFVTALTLDGASTVNARNITLQASGGGALTFSDGTTMTTKPYGLPVGGTTGQVLSKINSADYNVQWSTPSSGGGGIDIQTFGSSTTSGTFTWTKPAGAKWVHVYLWGAGNGGGSGARYATTSGRSGGSGGAGGPFLFQAISADFLNSTETVTVGAGGAGGAGRTTDTGGNSGNIGGSTIFKTYSALNSGAGGGGGASSPPSGQSATSVSILNSIATGTSSAGNITNGANAATYSLNYMAACGGGGGGGASASSTTAAKGGNGGGYGVSQSGNNSAIAGGTGGTALGVAATAGTSSTTTNMQGGTGGGGGYYITATAGGNGGNGGWPGGGGGGGGASDSGFNSGSGGNGANGFAVIITYT